MLVVLGLERECVEGEPNYIEQGREVGGCECALLHCVYMNEVAIVYALNN